MLSPTGAVLLSAFLATTGATASQGMASVGASEADLLPILLTGGGLVVVTLVGGLVLRRRGKRD